MRSDSAKCSRRKEIKMKNSNKNQVAAITIALLMASSSSLRAQSESSREAAGDIARPQTSSPTDFVDTLNSTFGKQTTQRATHAKGIVVLGKFTPSQTAQSLSKAHISGMPFL
jgi:catalase